MNYGRLILDVTKENGDINLINMITRNEHLADDCSITIKTLKIKILPRENQYSIDDSAVKLEIDNVVDITSKPKSSYFDIDYYMPLEMPNCKLNKITLKGNGKVLIDYGF